MKTSVYTILVFFVVLMLLGVFGEEAHAGGLVALSFDADNFSNPLTINNPYWPLREGTTFVYRSVAEDTCEVNDVEVTSNTRVITDVTTREIHDRVWADKDCDGGRDVLVENTLDWYAQDDDGNIWYFGELTGEATEHCVPINPGECIREGSWTAGEDVADVGSAAEAGIIILANPRPGDFYQQEFYTGEAEDLGKVLRLNARVSLVLDNALATDEYTDCLKTKEWTPLERGAIEHKYYCPGVGLVAIEALRGKTVRTELVDIIP